MGNVQNGEESYSAEKQKEGICGSGQKSISAMGIL
jgi:hypothetical protein